MKALARKSELKKQDELKRSNTEFSYLYRDASNYKQFGTVVFAGRISEDEWSRLKAACDSGEFFSAEQVRVPSVFLFGDGEYPSNEDDHCWHEVEDCRFTNKPADDKHGRTISQFIAEVESAAKKGWDVYEVRPAKDLAAYRQQMEATAAKLLE